MVPKNHHLFQGGLLALLSSHKLQYLRSHDVVFGLKKFFRLEKVLMSSRTLNMNMRSEALVLCKSLGAENSFFLFFFSTFTSLSFLLVQLTL